MSQSNNVINIHRHPTTIPPPPTGTKTVEDFILPTDPWWHAWAWGAVGFVVTIVACLLIATLAGCGGSQAPAEGVKKVAIQQSAQSCNDKAVAIIEAGETCEGIVRALNKLVASDPKCANVFHSTDPVKSCEGIGVQGKRSKEVPQ